MTTETTKDGGTKRVQNPAAKMAAQLEVSMRLLLKELSATPASREKTKQAALDPTKQPPREGTIGWYREHAAELEQETETEKETAKPNDFLASVSDSDVDFNS